MNIHHETISSTPLGTGKPEVLGIDIGGTGLKATLLDGAGAMVTQRQRIATTYPMSPEKLISALVNLVEPFERVGRAAAGFPGVVRDGVVLTAPHFVTVRGPGSKVDPLLLRRWTGFDLGRALSRALDVDIRIVNDAEMQALPVVTGKGIEVVLTLGTGIGTAAFKGGVSGPHLELAHHPFHGSHTYNEYLGDAARKDVGNSEWRGRVIELVDVTRSLFNFDHLYLGGGNSAHLDHGHTRSRIGSDVSLVDPNDGLIGAHLVWKDHL